MAETTLDAVYDEIDEMLRKGKFGRINDELEDCRTEATETDVLIAMLTVTLPARSQLPARDGFYQLAEQAIKDRGDWEDGLLDGLR